MDRRYYEAYDDRYRQVHGQDLRWFADVPTPIVGQVLERYGITKSAGILEIGCGEGRDAGALLEQGYDVLATDVSPAAIAFARNRFPEFIEKFRVLDCLTERLGEKFHFIYAVAVIHMLVPDADRDGFYAFIREHLGENGLALIGTMGDGTLECQSDISTAFDLQERIHEPTGQKVAIAGTSCRMVSWASFRRELERSGLEILESGITAAPPDFPQMMYALVEKSKL